jgi:eukaryotic-like serine/threonine-protein kinase
MPRVMQATEISAQLGPFDLVTPIGEPSGSGECWKLKKGSSEEALKIIVKNPEPERFDIEVRALERVDSPLVMDVHQFGDDLAAADGTHYCYLVSEFIDGGDVRSHLNAGSLPDDTQLRDFIDSVARGLELLHASQIIHRDIKPENIILRGGDWASPVIIDLGLSRLLDATTLTIYPWAAGTWPYMAPEQLRGERAIDRTDLWALGVMAAELADGAHPFLQGGETSPPPDWDRRIGGGVSILGSRPAGLRDFVNATVQVPAYRRPSAAEAIKFLATAWPPSP